MELEKLNLEEKRKKKMLQRQKYIYKNQENCKDSNKNVSKTEIEQQIESSLNEENDSEEDKLSFD